MTESADTVERLSSSRRVWLADLTHTQQLVTSDVMPAAIGCIATFAEAEMQLASRIRLFKYPERLSDALEADVPDVIGFSNYIWNFRLSYKYAEAIKQISPGTVTVFGGPNYPTAADEQMAFLKRHPAIDFYVVKEGEVGFALLLRSLIERDFDLAAVKSQPALGSVHWVRHNGEVVLSPEAPRLRDLTVIPSPYISGHLDEFFDGVLVPILQTNRGCPFGCTFCVEGVAYYNKVYRNSAEKLNAEIDYIGRKMAERRSLGGRNDLHISDSNFGMYHQDLDTCRALAVAMDKYGWPDYIGTTTGKNSKERVLEAAKLLKGALRLSGSVQSLDPTVLKNVKRDNISEHQILELAINANDVGANSYSEIILGLPGDSVDAHVRSLRTVVNAGFKNVWTWHLMLLPGSELATEETRRTYGMVTKYRVLPRCYGHFSVRGIPVVASEIEEICVANSTMSFEDYLACRRLHLIMWMFHNDAVFVSLVKLLKMLGVQPFDWLHFMSTTPVHGALKKVFDSFERQMREELWDDFEPLADFADRKESVVRYIAGEIGNNLLFLHKTLALTSYAQELAEFARDTTRALLRSANKLTPEVDEFIHDAVTYAACRLSHIFFDRDRPVRAALRYDLPAFEAASSPQSLRDFALPEPVEYSFVLSASQEDMISRYLRIWGSTPIGISRMIMKMYVNKFLRQAVHGEQVLESGLGVVLISGLQDSLSG